MNLNDLTICQRTQNFFNRDIFEPKDITTTIVTIALGILSLGIVHGITALVNLYRTGFQRITIPSEEDKKVQDVARNAIGVPSHQSTLPRAGAYNFQAELMNFFESENEIYTEADRTAFLEKFPILDKIIQDFQTIDQREMRNILVNALYVAAGIKPVLVVEDENNSGNSFGPYLRLIANAFPSLKLVETNSWPKYYLINETPIEEFDPRRFLKDLDASYASLELAACFAFPHQDLKKTDQMLSYLLGFGPTWESYANIRGGLGQRLYTDFSSESIFSDEHYLQLQEASHRDNPSTTMSRQELIENGKRLSVDLQNREFSANLFFHLDSSESMRTALSLYMYQHIDDFSYQTRYIQKGIAYRAQFLKLLGLPEK